MRKLVNKFVLNEREYYKNLYKDENINIDELGINFNTLVMEYYKDQNGMYYKAYLNGEEVYWNDLNNNQKSYCYEFEEESKVLQVT